MMMVSNELEKLMLYVGEKKITLGDVETMVLAAKQRSLYELTDAISSKDRVRALQMLDAMLIYRRRRRSRHWALYMLAKTFRQMLVILERNVRDQRMLWAALWQGFRVPPFAADDIIRQARRYKTARVDTGYSSGGEGGPGAALESREQTDGAGTNGDGSDERAEARSAGMDAGTVASVSCTFAQETPQIGKAMAYRFLF